MPVLSLPSIFIYYTTKLITFKISPLLLWKSIHETVRQIREGKVKYVYPLVRAHRIRSVRAID